VLRHHLAAGREAMKDTYEGLCSLVNKQGICYQCSGFRNNTPEGRKGPEVQPFLPEDAATGTQAEVTEARFVRRLQVVREHEHAGGVSERLHDLLFRRIRALERQTAGVT
jgi:RNA polymerase sigma-70 factor (ECF subfamily)